jgi:hypothetical protein
MIEIFGPSYRFTGEILTDSEIIYVNDHHYDEDNQCFHIKKLLENSACDRQKHLLVFDHINHEDELNEYNHICLPIFLAGEVQEFLNQKIQPDWSQKSKIFNFMINKPRLHREFLLIMIEHFGLHSYSHSLAWKKNNSNRNTLKARMQNSLYRNMVDQAREIIPVTNYVFGSEVVLDRGVKNGNFTNAETYNHLLRSTVFEPSCISLITEPSFFERETLQTEKTVMAMYGGTLPIWVGGWKLATYSRSLGFDVFDDIIDHSYEALDDPWDRCYYAIEKNLQLLTNFDQAKQVINDHQGRLRKNIKLLETNPYFKDCLLKIESYPEPIKSALFSISQQFRQKMFEKVELMHWLGERISNGGKKYDRSVVRFV